MFVAGLDLGQANDYTALTIVQAEGTTYRQRIVVLEPELNLPCEQLCELEGPPVSLRLRHLERFKLKTPYPEIVDQVTERLRRIPGDWLLAVDHTGVGAAVVDLFERARLCPIAITITGGDAVHGQGRGWRVPKRDLVGVLQVGFQSGRLKIARKLPLAETLLNELLNFKVKISAVGHDSYEAWRESIHDDLVLAAAVACWTAEQAIAMAAAQAQEAIQLHQAQVEFERFRERISPV